MAALHSARPTLLALSAAVISVALFSSVQANDELRRMPEQKIFSAPGEFLQWRDADHLVITTGAKTFSLLDLHSLRTVPLNTEEPDPGDVRIITPASTGPWKDTFPRTIIVTHDRTATKTTWFRYSYPDQPYLNLKHDLIDPSDGAIELYAAARSDQPIGEKATTLAPTRESRYALFNNADSAHRALPLDLTLSELTLTPNSNYRWKTLASRKDTGDSLYFVFFANERFLPFPEHDFQGWSPFNAWWIDVKAKATKHVVLPDGPWIADALKEYPLRKVRCYPSDCDDFRHYDFKVAGHKIFLRITADHAALSENILGIYEFEPSSNIWLKVADSDIRLEQIAPDGCATAIDQGREVSVFNLCLP